MLFLWNIREAKPIGHFEIGKINGDTLDQKGNNLLLCSIENKR